MGSPTPRRLMVRHVGALALAVASLLALPGRVAGQCRCKYQGGDLPESLYTNFPVSEPGKYQNLPHVRKYGTMCAAWDQMPGTPWNDRCSPNLDFSRPENNWCQIPWCYVEVNSGCPDMKQTSVFTGSDTHFYSFYACGQAPDCLSPGPDGDFGRGTPGCPYDPNGEGLYAVHKRGCECIYHHRLLPQSLLANYPSEDPGKYANLPSVDTYGTSCGSWDMGQATPYQDFCPASADFCDKEHNWCQAPWCYVDESCPTARRSAVFQGSNSTVYSYDTCLGTPDCYTDRHNENVPPACPFDSTHSGWSTFMDCPNGWRTEEELEGSAALPSAAPGFLAPALAAAAALAARASGA